MAVDATGIIRYIESGLMGHLNDAQTFGLMRRIGTELRFPEQCVLFKHFGSELDISSKL